MASSHKYHLLSTLSAFPANKQTIAEKVIDTDDVYLVVSYTCVYS